MLRVKLRPFFQLRRFLHSQKAMEGATKKARTSAHPNGSEDRWPLILDGAMGTELGAVQGSDTVYTLNVPLYPASTEGLESIKAVSRKYCKAGADIICTATYNVCDVRYERDTVGKEKVGLIPDILKGAVDCARAVVDECAGDKRDAAKRPLVAAVMGGYGVAAEMGADYDFDYTGIEIDTLVDFHHRRVTALLAGKPDILLFETISSFKEVQAIAKMLDAWTACAKNPLLPQVWLACSCRITENGEHVTGCGDSWEETTRFVDSIKEVSAFGINCTWPSVCSALLKEASKLTRKPLLAYPNNGVWNKAQGEWLPAKPEDFAKTMCEMLNDTPKLNLLAVGGCCCVGPTEIQALAEAVRSNA